MPIASYRRLAAASALALILGAQALPAQDNPSSGPKSDPGTEGDNGASSSLMEEGARLFLRGLMSEMGPTLDEMGRTLDEIRPALEQMGPQLRELVRLMGDVKNYAMPEMLPNGDILIRRKPEAEPGPTPPPEAPALPVPPGRTVPGPNGEIDL